MGIFKVKIRHVREQISFVLNWNLDKTMKQLGIPRELLTTNADTLTLKGAKDYFQAQEESELRPPMHPGCLIEKALEARGINQSDFGRVVGINRVIINQIIHGKRSITLDWALLFEEVLQVPAHLLLRMQVDYDLHQSRQRLLLARKEKHDYELRRRMDAVLARLGDLHYVRSINYHPNYEAYLREYYDSPQ